MPLWSLIASHLPGRTDNEIKNFWNSFIKKKLKHKGIDPNTQKLITDLQKPLAAISQEKEVSLHVGAKHTGSSQIPVRSSSVSDNINFKASQADQCKPLDMNLKRISNSTGLVNSSFESSQNSLENSQVMSPHLSVINRQFGDTPAFRIEKISKAISTAVDAMYLGSVIDSPRSRPHDFQEVLQFNVGTANYEGRSELPAAVTLQQQIDSKLTVMDSEAASTHDNTESLSSTLTSLTTCSREAGSDFSVNAQLCYPAKEYKRGISCRLSGDAAHCSVETNPNKPRMKIWDCSNNSSSSCCGSMSTDSMTFNQEKKQQEESNIYYGLSHDQVGASEPPCNDNQWIKRSLTPGDVDNGNVLSDLFTVSWSLADKLHEQLLSSVGSNTTGWQQIQDIEQCAQSQPDSFLFADMQLIAAHFDQML
ncbi:hypothetical protein O6H91_17G089900 [Diphasiastrum complanatum]|uniref:Uncharacterized protein n=1 Tax=Diphasiastrum complanatum TaxID=34168 RepID=A0ACC2B926_DIPCM|nr:hypothetical protein O6H91_17G089900 [Diphasiastrum complanatum]